VRPQFVFVPTRLNLHEIAPRSTSPRRSAAAPSSRPADAIGRCRRGVGPLGQSDADWQDAAAALRARAAARPRRPGALIYPWTS
jgi:hypothetical protein